MMVILIEWVKHHNGWRIPHLLGASQFHLGFGTSYIQLLQGLLIVRHGWFSTCIHPNHTYHVEFHYSSMLGGERVKEAKHLPEPLSIPGGP